MTARIKSREKIDHLLASETPIKWLFAGDSITHGAFHTQGYRDYPEHFAERVRWEKGRGRDHVITTAISGWRITTIADDLEWSVLQYRADVVSINVGMNDCTEGPDGVARFATAYREVLNRIRDAHDPAFILHTPNTIYHTPQGTRSSLSLYAAAIREIAAEYDAVLVDHEKDWLEIEKRQSLMFWLSDEIHPNEYGHRAMAHTLLRELGLFDAGSYVGRLMIP